MNNKEEIYQVKTIEAAVNTIMTRMDELRNASEEEQNILRRRWIGELIQNASDCMGENEVIVYIEHGENQ